MRSFNRSGRDYVAILGVAVCCYLALGVVLPALPGYVSETLHSAGLGVGIAVGAPALSAVMTRPAGGRLADRFGPRGVVMAGAAAMSAAAGLALGHPGLARLAAARLAAGAGEGAMMGATVAWLLRLSRPDRRGRALGHIGLANYLGLTLGPLLGQALPGGIQSLWLAAIAAPAIAVAIAAGLPPLGALPGAEGSPLLVSAAVRPGLGLALTNVGYAAVITFAGLVLAGRGVGLAAHVVPVYAATVAVLRIAAGSVPDRLGARRTALGSAALSTAGLAGLAVAATTPLAVVATLATATGQALLVPALGLLVLEHAGEDSQGAAAGTFFAFFDIGVGAGGPALGAVASVAGAPAAMAAAAGAVAIVPPVAGGASRSTQPSRAE